MHVLMIAKQKGGVGASTIARELGVVAAASGKRVVLIDLDPQGTTRAWWNRRTADLSDDAEPNPGLAAPRPADLSHALAELERAKINLVIIDTPPSIHAYLASVMRLAHLVLVPTRPTTDDLTALPAVLDMVEEAAKPFAFVVTQAPPGRSRMFDEAVPVLAQRGRVAPPLRLRMDFPVAAADGSVTTETAPDGKAAAEVATLWGFVEGEMGRLARRTGRTA